MNDHPPRSKEVNRETLGDQPVHIVTYIRMLSEPGSVYTQYNIDFLQNL